MLPVVPHTVSVFTRKHADTGPEKESHPKNSPTPQPQPQVKDECTATVTDSQLRVWGPGFIGWGTAATTFSVQGGPWDGGATAGPACNCSWRCLCSATKHKYAVLPPCHAFRCSGGGVSARSSLHDDACGRALSAVPDKQADSAAHRLGCTSQASKQAPSYPGGNKPACNLSTESHWKGTERICRWMQAWMLDASMDGVNAVQPIRRLPGWAACLILWCLSCVYF